MPRIEGELSGSPGKTQNGDLGRISELGLKAYSYSIWKQKLRLDFPGLGRMCRRMANFHSELSNRELISRISLEAGRIMENLSGELALALPSGTVGVEKRLDMLRQASLDIAAYSAAADSLHRRTCHSDPVS